MTSKEPNNNMNDFQRFFNTVEEFLFILDLRGSFLHFNTELTRCLGFTDEEMLQMNVTEIFSSDCKDEIMEILVNIPKGKMTESRIPLQTKDGHLIPVDTKFSAGSWNGEDAFYGVSRDVTERTRVEEELRESQKRYHILTDNVIDVLWVVDMNFQFTYFSSSVKEMFGYTVEEALAKSIDEIMTEESIETILKEFAKALSTDNPETVIVGSDPSIEVEMFHKDGSRMWVDLSRSFIRDDDGSPIGIMGVARNITSRIQAKEAQDREREAFRLIAESTVLATTVSDLCKRVVSEVADALELDIGAVRLFNQQEHRLDLVAVVGMNEEEVKKKAVSHTLDNPKTVTPLVRQTPQDIFTLDVTTQNPQKDGKLELDEQETRPFISWPIHGANQLLLGVMILMSYTPREISDKDITFIQTVVGMFSTVLERRRAEEKLSDTMEALNIAFEKSAIGMIWVTPEGMFIRANQAFCEIMGYSEEELLQKTLQDITFPEDYDSGTDIVNSIIDGEIGSGVIEKRYVHKDGTIIYCKMTTSLIRDDQNNPIHFSTQVEDVTAQNTATIALQESEAKFRLITENSPGHIMLHSLDGEILFINRTFPDLTIDEVIGKSMFDLTPPKFLDIAVACFRRVFETGVSDMYQTEYTTKDGRIYHFEVKLGAITKDGKVVSILSSSYDITEQKRFSEELEKLVEERTKELENAQDQLIRSERLAILGQLSGGISHEIRNPLGTIKNSVYYLRMHLDESPYEIMGTLDILDSAIDSAESIVKSLLDYTQPKSRNLKKTNITDIVNSSLSCVSIPEGIMVSKILDSKIPDIIADYIQLERVIVNLCVNAIQAMEESGILTLKTEVSELGWLKISVSDTGKGMTEETREHLFEPLFTTKAKGIGLGLPIANLFTKAHGGSIEVQSTLGKGTTFTVNIPIHIGD